MGLCLEKRVMCISGIPEALFSVPLSPYLSLRSCFLFLSTFLCFIDIVGSETLGRINKLWI